MVTTIYDCDINDCVYFFNRHKFLIYRIIVFYFAKVLFFTHNILWKLEVPLTLIYLLQALYINLGSNRHSYVYSFIFSLSAASLPFQKYKQHLLLTLNLCNNCALNGNTLYKYRVIWAIRIKNEAYLTLQQGFEGLLRKLDVQNFTVVRYSPKSTAKK